MSLTCAMCERIAEALTDGMCPECAALDREWSERIGALEAAGHTTHCACRMIWGDGECTCPGDGTGSEYHTMNPPPGGWRSYSGRPTGRRWGTGGEARVLNGSAKEEA